MNPRQFDQKQAAGCPRLKQQLTCPVKVLPQQPVHDVIHDDTSLANSTPSDALLGEANPLENLHAAVVAPVDTGFNSEEIREVLKRPARECP